MPCPAGSYYDNKVSECIRCKRGSYQPKSGQSVCIICSEMLITAIEGAIDSSECEGTISKMLSLILSIQHMILIICYICKRDNFTLKCSAAFIYKSKSIFNLLSSALKKLIFCMFICIVKPTLVSPICYLNKNLQIHFSRNI